MAEYEENESGEPIDYDVLPGTKVICVNNSANVFGKINKIYEREELIVGKVYEVEYCREAGVKLKGLSCGGYFLERFVYA